MALDPLEGDRRQFRLGWGVKALLGAEWEGGDWGAGGRRWCRTPTCEQGVKKEWDWDNVEGGKLQFYDATPENSLFRRRGPTWLSRDSMLLTSLRGGFPSG